MKHNVLLVGPPGSGKTMLARRIVTILPPLSFEEALECTKIHSISGLLPAGQALLTWRPFRSPHHSISDAGLIGGGSVRRPGDVRIAHHDVYFLEELPELRPDELQALRQPLKSGRPRSCFFRSRQLPLSARPSPRAPRRGSSEHPICYMNPCPCGHFGDLVHSCSCSSPQIARYLARISGPLLDRIDIQIEVPRLPHDDLLSMAPGESSAAIRERVCAARAIQQARFGGSGRWGGAGKARAGVFANGAMGARQIRQHCRVGEAAKELLRAAIQQLGLSARAYDRILKLARTVADLSGSEGIEVEHVAEAIQYRTLDRKLWG